MVKKMKEKLFKTWITLTDIGHSGFGFISFMLTYHSFYLLALISFCVYALYQFLDYLSNYENEEAKDEIIKDLKEYVAGFGGGIIYVAYQLSVIPLSGVLWMR